jgi:epoxide hydrolase-like predicted phosphatase
LVIRALVFDFGNVVCTFDNTIFLRRLTACTEKSISELEELIYRSSDISTRFETGDVTSEEFFSEIVSRCGLRISHADFIRAFTDIFTPILTTIQLIKNAKSHYKLALLSNTNELDFEHAIKQTEVFGLFDVVTVSFEVHALKPAEKIYRDVLAKLDLQAFECLYVDDIRENVDAARRLGFHAVHYTSYERLLDEFRRLEIGW